MTWKSKVFLAYDERMMLHRPKVLTEDTESPHFNHERPSRLLAVYQTLMALEKRLVTEAQHNNDDLDMIQSILRGQEDEKEEQGHSVHNTGTLRGPDHAHDPRNDYLLADRRFIPLHIAPASRDMICRVHTEEHYEFMKRTSTLCESALDKLSDDSQDLYFCKDTFGAALLAVGGCVAAVDAATSPFRESRRAMALVRPPAHHATKDAAMGKSRHIIVVPLPCCCCGVCLACDS